jgi:hypothetical protein
MKSPMAAKEKAMKSNSLKGLIFFLLLFILSGCRPTTPSETSIDSNEKIALRCGDSVCQGPENSRNCPEDCKGSITIEPTPEQDQRSPQEIQDETLYIGIMVHLEGWKDDQDEDRFKLHAQLVRDYADLFESHGAVLSLESKEFTDGSIRWGDNVLLEMEQRGHGIGVHADIGGQSNYNCDRFANDLRIEREQLESLGVTVQHVSGTTSHCDWVTASLEAGYKFTTGVVAYSVLSLQEDIQPQQFQNCRSPADCHQPFPIDLADRLAPWRADSGLDWTNAIEEGGLVIIPSGGGLACMYEESLSSESFTMCDFTEEDITASIQELEEALTYIEADEINTYYVSWSLGDPLDQTLLTEWLQAIEPFVDSGQVQWVSLLEMYDLFVELP